MRFRCWWFYKGGDLCASFARMHLPIVSRFCLANREISKVGRGKACGSTQKSSCRNGFSACSSQKISRRLKTCARKSASGSLGSSDPFPAFEAVPCSCGMQLSPLFAVWLSLRRLDFLCSHSHRGRLLSKTRGDVADKRSMCDSHWRRHIKTREAA